MTETVDNGLRKFSIGRVISVLLLLTIALFWIWALSPLAPSGHPDKLDNSSFADGDKDSLYTTAVDIIKTEGKASTSFLQRKLQIGYNRAARIMDMMEQEGIVSKANHVGKRDVLKK